MFTYYLRLAVTSMRRTPVLTGLMVLAVAMGIGASMTALTVLRAMAQNPYSHKNEVLRVPQLDSWNPESAYDEEGNPPDQFTYRDARALLDAGKADYQSAQYRTGLSIQPEQDSLLPFNASIRVAGSDFFQMFEPAFRYGNPWTRADDARKIVGTYGFKRDVVEGASEFVFHPTLGDIYLFDTRKFHEVKPSDGHRTTISAALGLSASDPNSISIWS